MNHPEDDLQAACVEWFELQYPYFIIYAIPNGGKRNKFEAKRLKKTGVRAGIPDICILAFNDHLYVEMKSKTGVYSPAQKEMIKKFQQNAVPVHECRSVGQFIAIVNNWIHEHDRLPF